MITTGKWNPITDKMRNRERGGFPMTDCDVLITVEKMWGKRDVIPVRLKAECHTKDGTQYAWYDIRNDMRITGRNDKCVKAWMYCRIPRPYEGE